jgi:hypothetical protein
VPLHLNLEQKDKSENKHQDHDEQGPQIRREKIFVITVKVTDQLFQALHLKAIIAIVLHPTVVQQ